MYGLDSVATMDLALFIPTEEKGGSVGKWRKNCVGVPFASYIWYVFYLCTHVVFSFST